MEGITGVALDFPSQYDDPVALRGQLDAVGLQLGMTEIDMYSSGKWKFEPEDAVRRTESDGNILSPKVRESDCWVFWKPVKPRTFSR